MSKNILSLKESDLIFNTAYEFMIGQGGDGSSLIISSKFDEYKLADYFEKTLRDRNPAMKRANHQNYIIFYDNQESITIADKTIFETNYDKSQYDIIIEI
jgi:hypothetical protein